MNFTIRYLPAIGQLLTAAIFIVSGFSKIAAPAMTQGYIASAGLPVPMVAYLIAIVIEVSGGLFLVIGFHTRATAAVLAAFVVATALSFHHDFVDQNQLIHFLKNIAIAGGLLQVLAFGAGSFSFDNRRTSLDLPAPTHTSERSSV
jgi:putative oxidoreductase